MAIEAEPVIEFQSAPGGEAGGNGALVRHVAVLRKFQSAPGGEAGGNAERGLPS